uniref:Uncharacterized protein n=1 Tax=Tetranychus urticae TaxID=32264 RepID=T1JVP1_TETUR
MELPPKTQSDVPNQSSFLTSLNIR